MTPGTTHQHHPVGEPVPGWVPPARPTRAVLQGVYCRLEPLDGVRHAESLFAANRVDASGANWSYLPYGPFDAIDSYRAWLDQVSGGDDPMFLAIVDAATQRAVGVASYLRIDPRNGSIEVGHINYSPLLQRSRAATETMYLMMRNAFELGYRRYEWKCNALNQPSRVAAQRLGLSFEGVFRQATVVKGRNRDTAWYAAIDREWPALDAAFRRWLDPANFDAAGNQRLRLADLTRAILVNTG